MQKAQPGLRPIQLRHGALHPAAEQRHAVRQALRQRGMTLMLYQGAAEPGVQAACVKAAAALPGLTLERADVEADASRVLHYLDSLG